VQAALRAAPTLASCLACMLVMARCKHPAALPATLAAIVAIFHAVLLAAGVSLAQAQQAGWVLKPAVSAAQPLLGALQANAARPP
jgi:glucan phosphoethanolaminetransferase (alkaline phosphatase superfamily)